MARLSETFSVVGEPKSEEPQRSESLFGWTATVKSMGRSMMGLFNNRMELFLLELQEERDHWVRVLFVGMIALVFGTLCLVVLSLIWLVWMWDSHPVLALLGLACLYGGLSLAALWKLRRLMTQHLSFHGSMGELKKDKQWLDQKK